MEFKYKSAENGNSDVKYSNSDVKYSNCTSVQYLNKCTYLLPTTGSLFTLAMFTIKVSKDV